MIRLFFRNYRRFWSHHKAIFIATLSVLTFTFLIQTLFLSLCQNMINIVERWGDSSRMTVYLKDDLDEEKLLKLKGSLQSMNFSRVQYSSKEEASVQFKKKMQNYLPDLLDDDQFRNPFPASFELGIPRSMFDALGTKGLAQKANELLPLEGVDDVSYGGDWITNYRSFVGFIYSVGWILMGLLLFAGLFVIGNSIQASVNQRRAEIEILELVGATPFMVRGPFVFEGALTGILASLLALFFGYFVYFWASQKAIGSLAFWGMSAELQYLKPMTCILVVVTGTLLGALGSYLCVRRLNDGWAAAQGSS